MSGQDKLEPPKGGPIEDPGAHELGTNSKLRPTARCLANLGTADSSDSEDHFSDAQSAPMSPPPSSPIPKTRVEKVDDEPSYGEVPGTDAYAKREQDAQPDEIAIASEDASSQKSTSTIDAAVPTTILEEAPGDGPKPRSPEHEEKHKADAPADVVLDADGHIKAIDGEDFNGTGHTKT